MKNLTIVILSHGRLHYVIRSLKYYARWIPGGKVVVAWSGGEPDVAQMEDAAAGLDFRVEAYPAALAFHHKIKTVTETIDTDFVFLIGDDDLANVSIADEAIDLLEKNSANFCGGTRIQVNAHENVVKPNWSEIFHQPTLEMRLAFKLVRSFSVKKTYVSNWHIYGIHRTTSLQKAMDILFEFPKYSAWVEDLLLILLSLEAPWVRTSNPIAVHEGDNIKLKSVKGGGYDGWGKGKLVEGRTSELRREYLEKYLDEATIAAYEDARINGLGDIKTPTWFDPNIFRCYVHELLATPVIDRKKNHYVSRLEKSIFKFKLLLHFLGSWKLTCELTKRVLTGDMEGVETAIIVLGDRNEIYNFLSAKMTSDPAISDAIKTIS